MPQRHAGAAPADRGSFHSWLPQPQLSCAVRLERLARADGDRAATGAGHQTEINLPSAGRGHPLNCQTPCMANPPARNIGPKVRLPDDAPSGCSRSVARGLSFPLPTARASRGPPFVPPSYLQMRPPDPRDDALGQPMEYDRELTMAIHAQPPA